MAHVVHWCEASVADLAPWDTVFERWLDDAERARAARFAFHRDRVRYCRAHGLLRGVLGRATGVNAGAMAFAADAGGKPALASRSGWSFSLSHAGDRVLVAWAEGVEVGADVEQVRPGIAAEGIGERFLAVDEAAFIAAAAAPDAAFTRVWARKEALVKAWGDGLAADLRGFSVAGERLSASIVAPPGCSGTDRVWWCQDLDVAGPYRAALAGDGPPARLQCSVWPARP